MYQIPIIPDKREILERIPQQEIFQRYLGFSDLKQSYRSPFREDKNPNCKFRWYNGRLYFHDYNQGERYDCFDVVMKIYGLTFGEALSKIILDFSMIKDTNVNRNIVKLIDESVQRPSGQKIEYKRQLWQSEDVRYWSQYGVNSEVLGFYKVYSVKNLWLNENLIYTWRKDDLCYAYEFGGGNIKIYFPNRTERRFICNTNCLQGYHQLPKYGGLLGVTSSLKDVMTWHRLGVWTIAKQSENQLLTPEEYGELSGRFDQIFINLDDDLTGRKFTLKYQELYPVESFFVPEGKDVSGYVKMNGVFKGQELINQFKLQLT